MCVTGGATYCAVVSLSLLGLVDSELAGSCRNRMLQWCVRRLCADGVSSRCGKAANDCSYIFWLVATMTVSPMIVHACSVYTLSSYAYSRYIMFRCILHGYFQLLKSDHLLNKPVLRRCLLRLQSAQTGGFSAAPGRVPGIFDLMQLLSY